MGGKPLPYDAVVEYLESTGTQWIDTGIYPTATISVLFRVTASRTTSNFIFGSRPSASINSLSYAFLVEGNNYFRADWIGESHEVRFSFSDEYSVTANQQTVTVNGVAKSVVAKQTNGLRFYLCSCNTNGTASLPMRGKIYYCQIFDGETLVRDFIPVRVGQVGYMYDRVSGQLFGNAGTGAFIIGNDVND